MLVIWIMIRAIVTHSIRDVGKQMKQDTHLIYLFVV